VNRSIPIYETDLLSAAIERIISNEVLENDLSGKLPTIDAMRDSNTVYRGKASVLFVDMRHSTQLPELFSPDQLVKIYRSYIRTVVQAIRYSGGFVRDFMGDGVLAVFVDSEHGSSEDNAVRAAKYIVTSIDKFLNPVLFHHLNHRISYGVGIHTGDISLSKVGMKGKEQNENVESEFGIAWIGNSTNLACKQSGAVGGGAIFISPSTYSAISDINEKKKWHKVEIANGNNTLSGFLSEHNYLPYDAEIAPCKYDCFDNDIAPCSTGDKVNPLQVITEKIDELSEVSEDIGKRKEEIEAKEMVLSKKEELLNTKEKFLNSAKYHFHCDVLRSGHCESEHVKAMGKDFWEDHLADAISCGATLGKNEHAVKQEVSYMMVSIYDSLELYDKAYDFLVEQALGGPWLSVYVTQEIVKKVKYCERLKSAIEKRLSQYDLNPTERSDFITILDWLYNNC